MSKIGLASSIRMRSGKIVFNGRNSVIDCVVLGLSPEGARLGVASALGVPHEFQLLVAGEERSIGCEVKQRSAKEIHVAFVGSLLASYFNPAPPHP